jgi:hypothetical protein
VPVLRSLIIGDTASAWTAGGFEVVEQHGRAHTTIGEVTIELAGPDGGRGIVAWRIDEIGEIVEIDGITTLRAPPPATELPSPGHPNLSTHLDHVVMFTPDLDRTVGALAACGFEARRIRDVPGNDQPKKQVFFWAGPTIIELVGPVEPTGSGPASLWGLAVTCANLEAAGRHLGDRLGQPKDAVQRGRRIATLRTRDLDISTPIALMTPHQGGTDA